MNNAVIIQNPAACTFRVEHRALALSAFIWLIVSCFAKWTVAAETLSPVFQQALPNVSGKTMTVVQVDLAPGTRAEPHRHGQAFLFAYVLKGRVRSQLEGQAPQTFVAGQSWPEPPGSHHVLTENLSATEPAQLLVVFVADTGSKLKVDDVGSGAK